MDPLDKPYTSYIKLPLLQLAKWNLVETLLALLYRNIAYKN